MRITDLMIEPVMIMDLRSATKEAVIDELIASLNASGRINDVSAFKQAILAREAQSSTGIGEGIAMPHAKTSAVNQPTIVFGKSTRGVNYESLDDQPAYFFFMIAVPEGESNLHLQALKVLSRMLLDADFLDRLRAVKTPGEVTALFDAAQTQSEAAEAAEKAKRAESARQSDAAVGGSASGMADVIVGNPSSDQFVVAVTACPTGIAHTFMAEDALKKKAKELGINIRVETNGSEGVGNELTAAEIARANGVIIAADKNVEMARFDGKPVLQRKVSDGIRKPEELIRKAVTGDAPIYRHEGGAAGSSDAGGKVSVGGKIYKDLMNGISHMLPFVVGGGILIAISFLFEQYGGGGSENPIFKLLMGIGGGDGAFHFLIPILAGFIAMSIGDRPALMPGIVAGYMASTSGAGFLGGLAAGFLAGYIVIGLRKLFRGLPKSIDGLKPILIYPVLGLLAVGLVMYYIIDPVFGGLNTWITNVLENLGTGNAILLGLLLGGMMAIDMGGPFNKAAYTFAIGIFTSTGDGAWMAAVMAGGMVPPLAIALATTLFKNKFTEEERKSGLTNYVLGASFITEGAIPFAAADPLRVLTSCIIGSAIAGGLTQWWAINVPAPHGGIFVAALANHAVLFLLTVVIGAVISGLILGFWKKTLAERAAITAQKAA
ncbi:MULTISPECIES: PTS fructose transporter subunit IIABC [Saccharibacillus]|uniref:PTS fructose transporter subunit IIABC n=1 Tax=Saccharibacillus TaxID=456492 RepID=UPI00123949CC|nr:PTS fructose transporter subunit IIABC [Saccharibacillus sp. WB 17]MWJ32077.1 PTS fructose transporter subunit IIC [Saccharibacillus sp. WB 17]